VELEHHFTVPASVEQTWAAFNDPASVAPCFPGATLISVEGDQFTGSAKIKLGPIALQYNGTGTYLERDEVARRAVIEARGKDKRGNGTANARVTAQLQPDGAGTAVHVTTDLAITGKPAQFGRGVMQDVSDKLLRQFVACLQTKLGTAEVMEVRRAAQPAPAPGLAPSVHQGPSSRTAPAAGATSGPTPREDGTEHETARGPDAPAYLPPSPSTSATDVELNLLQTVVPVLLKRYAWPLAGILAVIGGYLMGRRARR